MSGGSVHVNTGYDRNLDRLGRAPRDSYTPEPRRSSSCNSQLNDPRGLEDAKRMRLQYVPQGRDRNSIAPSSDTEDERPRTYADRLPSRTFSIPKVVINPPSGPPSRSRSPSPLDPRKSLQASSGQGLRMRRRSSPGERPRFPRGRPVSPSRRLSSPSPSYSLRESSSVPSHDVFQSPRAGERAGPLTQRSSSPALLPYQRGSSPARPELHKSFSSPPIVPFPSSPRSTPEDCPPSDQIQPPVNSSTVVQGPLHIGPAATVNGTGDGAFSYRQLELNEIRLLRLLPERMSIIKCDIISVSLEEPPEYTAVSYSWGDADDTQNIMIGGDKVSITSSLHGALKALRQKKEVLVWADSLCINQKDLDERSQQVQLMATIYARAESVAIWLGPEADGSNEALNLLDQISTLSHSLPKLLAYVSPEERRPACSALVSLFERDYWSRLWVVQEVFNAQAITVYCGEARLSWSVFKRVRDVFKAYEAEMKPFFVTDWSDDERRLISRHRLRYSHVLTQGGPSSFPDVDSLIGKSHGSLLEVLYACRTKLSADPRDKVFAILGLLPMDIGEQFRPNYNLAVKDVYISVVDYLLTTTHRLDVICEAIHYPLHVSPIRLPSWVPDWSHIPQREMLRKNYDFWADDHTKAQYRFLDEHGNPAENASNFIEIEGIKLGTIDSRGIAVDVLHGLDDYLMAFLHWRALLQGNDPDGGSDRHYKQSVQEAFCRTLCLGQVPERFEADRWVTICYYVFATLIRDRLPSLALDPELADYADRPSKLDINDCKRILDEACHHSMQGRSFCLTNRHFGLGSGYLGVGDIIVVALGCHTPIILRPDPTRNRYKFVGDVYIDGYMYGKAVKDLKRGRGTLEKFVLH